MFLYLFVLIICSANILCSSEIHFQKCQSSDDDCLAKSVQSAYAMILEPNESIDAEDMDPMYQPIIDGDMPALNVKFYNSTITGFKSCETHDLKYEETEQKIHIELLCPKLVMEGQYNIDGLLLELAVKGYGDYMLQTGQYNFAFDLDLKQRTIDGKSYLSVKSFQAVAKPLDNLQYNFKNLFDNNKELAETVLKFANENSKLVAYFTQDKIFKENIRKIIRNANQYLKNVPVEDFKQ